jgi:hypothetical protein
MKNTFFSKRIWLVAMLAALVLIFTLSVFADAASANTETSAIDLISYQVKADENGAFSVHVALRFWYNLRHPKPKRSFPCR